MFTVGGTDVHIHKYLGPKQIASADATAAQPNHSVVAETYKINYF